MANAQIKCPKCGTFYKVIPSDLNESQLVYNCGQCGNSFQVEFFDYCPNCHVNIRFLEGKGFESDMKYVGSLLAKTFITGSSFSSLSKLAGVVGSHILGNTIDSNGDGECPICRDRYARCPTCNELTQIPHNISFKDNYTCKKCGQSVSPGTAANHAYKHSKEYYKH